MHRLSLFIVPAAAVLALGVVGITAQAASAAPTPAPQKGAPAHVASAGAPTSSKMSALPSAKAFHGYQQITSALLSDPASTQVSGVATCPTGTKVIGGGAIISSSSLSENLNASVPLTDGVTWKVYVNNASTTAGTFRVYANCITKAAGKYSVVVGTGVSNAAGAQTVATVACPTGTVPIGGGGFASSGSTAVNLNSSIPLSNGWRTDVNNGSTSTNTATAYVVCGHKPTGYVQVVGTATTLNAGTQGHGSASCPAGTTVYGGGAFSSSGSTVVNMNSTAPSGSTAWISYENNGTTAANTVTAYAVCGKTAA